MLRGRAKGVSPKDERVGERIALREGMATDVVCWTCDRVIREGEGRYRTPYGDHHARCFEDNPDNVWLKVLADLI